MLRSLVVHIVKTALLEKAKADSKGEKENKVDKLLISTGGFVKNTLNSSVEVVDTALKDSLLLVSHMLHGVVNVITHQFVSGESDIKSKSNKSS